MIKRIGFTDDKVVIGYPSLGIQVFAFLTVSLGLCVNAGSKFENRLLLAHINSRPQSKADESVVLVVSSRREHYWHIATKPRPRHATWRVGPFFASCTNRSLSGPQQSDKL